MTLVIAGYNLEKKNELLKSHQRSTNYFDARPSGVFIAADSAITDPDGKTLLNGFRKIYGIPVRLWKPYFVGKYFRSYQSEYQSLEVILAFAGSTLTAQHYLNSVTEHLAKLRITCERGNGPITYRVALDCESNLLYDSGTVWDEDTFTSSNYPDLLTAKVIADAVHHSLEHAMRSAKKYKLDEAAFNSLNTPFILGVNCPSAGTYHIYEYSMNRQQMDGIFTIRIEKRELPHDEVAVIGMKMEFDNAAQVAFKTALQRDITPAIAIFDFLIKAISTVNERGDKGIAHPAIIKYLENGAVKTLQKTIG